jgi:hypothetical protein
VKNDGMGFPCFYNEKTKKTEYEDPRFVDDEDADLVNLRKFILQELRFCVYLCNDLYENYNKIIINIENNKNNSHHKNLDTINNINKKLEKDLFKSLLAIKKSSSPMQLSGIVLKTLELYTKKSIVDKNFDKNIMQEIDYAKWLSESLAKLTDEANIAILNRKDEKFKLINDIEKDKSSVFLCPFCKRESKKNLTFCKNCGKLQVF